MDGFATLLPETISKLDVIEHHLIASIQMIAMEANPISTHVIVMACDEMIQSFADAKGVFIEHDYRIYIKDEFHKQYRKLVRKPYNYFKHADDDAHLDYDGPSLDELSDANELKTLLNGAGYLELGGTKKALCNTFAVMMAIKRPKLFKQTFIDSFKPELKLQFENAQKNVQFVIPVLRQMLCQQGVLPEIVLLGRTSVPPFGGSI